MAVLGSILLMPDVCDDLVMILKADDFYDDANRKLYQHMTDMVDLGQKIDPTLLVNRLKAASDYEAVGGSTYWPSWPIASPMRLMLSIMLRSCVPRRRIAS